MTSKRGARWLFMFIVRYDTYAISSLRTRPCNECEHSLQARGRSSCSARSSRGTLARCLQSMANTQVAVSRSSPALTLTRSPSLPMRPCSGCEYRQEGGQVDQHGAHVGHWQKAAILGRCRSPMIRASCQRLTSWCSLCCLSFTASS